MTNVNNNLILDKNTVSRIGLKVVIQAIRDFAFPQRIDAVRARILRLNKEDPMYRSEVERIYRSERRKIIKDLKSDFVIYLSDGKSEEVAGKLQRVMNDKTGLAMVQFKRRVRSFDNEKEA